MPKQPDFKAILMFASIFAIGYVLFRSYAGESQKPETVRGWGPMAGSGPGIAPEIIEAECPRHKQRDVEMEQVQGYNPAAARFASV